MSNPPVVVTLPYDKPPLSANTRLFWAEEAKRRKKIRGDVRLLVRDARLGLKPLKPGQKLKVQLVYTPATNRRRDTDNLVPTLKPICDGIVDAGLVEDDTPDYMVKPEPIIEKAMKRYRHRVRIELTILEGESHGQL